MKNKTLKKWTKGAKGMKITTDEDNKSMTINWGRSDGPSERREEHFTASGPITAELHTASGDIVVRTSSGTEISVIAIGTGEHAAERLADAIIEFDSARQVLRVVTLPNRTGRTKFFDFGRDDLDLQVTIPESSSLDVHTASGDIHATGTYATTEIASASGDVSLDKVSGDANVNLASGDVSVNEVEGPVSVKTASGDISVLRAIKDCKLHSVSGDLYVVIAGALEANLKTVSGDIQVKIEPGYTIAVNATTMSGDLHSDIDLDGNAGTSSAGTVTLEASTLSGDVTIQRA